MPVGRLSVAEGKTASVHLREPVQQVRLGGRGIVAPRPPHLEGIDANQGFQPVPAGVRSRVAERCAVELSHTPSNVCAGAADVHDPLAWDPILGEAICQLMRRRSLTIDPQRRYTLNPASQRTEVERRRLQRLGRRHHVHAGPSRGKC